MFLAADVVDTVCQNGILHSAEKINCIQTIVVDMLSSLYKPKIFVPSHGILFSSGKIQFSDPLSKLTKLFPRPSYY